MGLGDHGKKRPLPDGETSESKRGFSRRGSSAVDAATVMRDVSGYVSSEQLSAKFSRPHHDRNVLPKWREDLYSGVDSEAYIIGNIVTGRYSIADKPSTCTSISGVLRSSTTGDLGPQLALVQSLDNEFVEFEQHRNWARSLRNRKNEGYVSWRDTCSSSTNGFLILNDESIEGSVRFHARRIKARLSKLPNYRQLPDGNTEKEQRGSHLVGSHYGIPIWRYEDGSFREGHAVHQSDFGWHGKVKKAPHRPTFAILQGKMMRDYSASPSTDERSRFSISVDQARVADHCVSLHHKASHSEGVSALLDGLQESFFDPQPEPVSTRDAFSGELENERQFISYVHSSGRHSVKEEAPKPTIDHEFEELFSALLLN